MTSVTGDIKLFNRVREDDFIAFETLFKKYYECLCVFAEHYVGEPEMAKEIVSDFFLKFWENRKSIRIHNSVKNYYFASIHNQCLKYLEHLKVLKKYRDYAETKLKNIQVLDSFSNDYPLSKLISKEIVNEIEISIENLPDKCKKIFKLSRFENKSYEEIASTLSISINTVRTQMSRALEKLRLDLSKYLSFILPICYFIKFFFFND
jgi:RNA polymerase sigma-70 factor, ECF subfamily